MWKERKPSLSPLMEEVVIGWDMMWIYLESQILSGTHLIVIWALKMGMYILFSDGTMENGRSHRNLPLQMRRLKIGLELVWPYLEIPLSLGPIMITRGAIIADMVKCTPLLAGSRTRVASEFLRMVQLIMSLFIILPFRGVMISSVPFMQENKMVDPYILSICLFPDKNIFIWMYNFSYYKLYVNNYNVYIYLKIIYAQIGSGGRVIYYGFLFLVVLDFPI